MRENGFSENSCSGRKTNSPSFPLLFGQWADEAGHVPSWVHKLSLQQDCGEAAAKEAASASTTLRKPPPLCTSCLLWGCNLLGHRDTLLGTPCCCFHERPTAGYVPPSLGKGQTITPGTLSEPLGHNNRWGETAGITVTPRHRIFWRARPLLSLEFQNLEAMTKHTLTTGVTSN